MSEEQIIAVLRAIYILATLPYPFAEDGPRVDPRLAFAMGQILGIANEILSQVDPK